MAFKIDQWVIDKEQEVTIQIKKHASTFDLDPNLIRALITQESRFIAKAVSPTGAFGFGQMTGIGARQVQNIAAMLGCPDPSGLDTFIKDQASEPDIGIKAICATLWWLFNVKYVNEENLKIKLEAVLTFYNSGGKAAYLVIKHRGHTEAIPYIKQLPEKYQSQSLIYAPEVAQWYVAWHDLQKSLKPTPPEILYRPAASRVERPLEIKYRALIQTLLLLNQGDCDVMLNVRDGLTEVTLILPGEFVTDATD